MATSIALRGSEGIWIVNGAPGHDSTPLHICDQGKTCKAMTYSADGRLLAWATADSVYIMDVVTYAVRQQLPQTRVADLRFSPRATALATWGPYFVDREGKGGEPNLIIWDVESGAVRKSLTQKKQVNWEPQWSFDEGICCRNVNNELHFFENNNFDSIQNKLHLQKVVMFSIPPQGPAPYVISAYVAGSKGQPSYVRVYRYPDFGGPAAAVANKSFYKADRVNMYWNKIGTGLVILTSTESSDSSYYGEQGLHYISTNGDSCLVPLDKKGPIYSVMWNCRSTEFCVVYGYMPSKAALFNLKCEPVFDFGTGPRNHCYYNPQGNMAGFGNLAGHLEFWDLKQKKEISRFKAPDTTNFLWSPDGEHILMATVSPRLRVGNCYKLWHYTGSLLAHVPTTEGQELWDVQWQPVPEGTFKEKPVRYKPSEPGLASPENKKTEAYRPPQARDANYTPTAKLHEYEPASNIRQAQAAADKPTSKNKKKRDARKAKATADGEDGEGDRGEPAPVTTQPSAAATAPSTGDPEKDKKIRNIKKKIQQIEKLKDQQKSGKQLELNQMEKLKTEAALLKELEDLELG